MQHDTLSFQRIGATPSRAYVTSTLNGYSHVLSVQKTDKLKNEFVVKTIFIQTNPSVEL